MKFISYLRVSTDKQDVETQEVLCMDYIKSKSQGKKVEYKFYSDPDTSTRLKMKKRKILMEFLNSLQKGDHVVIYKLDRLSRDIIEMVTIWRMIVQEKKCILHSLSDSNCQDEFIIGIMGSMAQKAREDISLTTKDNLRKKILKGERTGNIPYGYQVCKNTLIPIRNKQTNEMEMKLGKLIVLPSEQEVLSLIFQYFEQGMSYQEITTELNNLGYRNREGKPFQKMSIYRILRRTGHTKLEDQLLDERVFEMSQ